MLFPVRVSRKDEKLVNKTTAARTAAQGQKQLGTEGLSGALLRELASAQNTVVGVMDIENPMNGRRRGAEEPNMRLLYERKGDV